MGLMNKLKNILFEEEEVEIPVIEKKEKNVSLPVQQPVYKDTPKKEQVREAAPVDYSGFLESLEEDISGPKQLPRRTQEVVQTPVASNRENLQRSQAFNFPSFDEEEFENMAPRPRETNVMEYERKKQEKKQEKIKVEKKVEIRQPDPPKFKPSPIISPVYGILDKNYTPDEITTRRDLGIARALDVDSVRKKAFGTLENSEVVHEEKYEEATIENNKILEERLEKARTIDELLNDSSDDIITLDDLEEDTELPSKEDIEEDLTYKENKKSQQLEESKKEEVVEEDTLESDLFDLIDSMYENREDGE